MSCTPSINISWAGSTGCWCPCGTPATFYSTVCCSGCTVTGNTCCSGSQCGPPIVTAFNWQYVGDTISVVPITSGCCTTYQIVTTPPTGLCFTSTFICTGGIVGCTGCPPYIVTGNFTQCFPMCPCTGC